jgi:hypothetical protein
MDLSPAVGLVRNGQKSGGVGLRGNTATWGVFGLFPHIHVAHGMMGRVRSENGKSI